MRGPKNPEDYRVDYYRSRYYCDRLPADDLRPEGPMKWDPKKKAKSIEDGQALPAQSTITKAIPSDALLYWATGKVAEYAVDQREKWEKLDRDDAVALLKKAHSKESGKAADRGSSIHEYVEAKLYRQPFDVFHLHEDAVAYVHVVDAFFENEKPELVVAEVVGIGSDHGVTTDAIVRFASTPEEYDLVDWKSRNATVRNPHVVYEKEVAQLGANLDVRYWIVEDDDGNARREPLPESLGAVLVTFTPTSYAVHRVDPVAAVDGWRKVLQWSKDLADLPSAASEARIVNVDDPEGASVSPSNDPVPQGEPETEIAPETATEPVLPADMEDPVDAETLRKKISALLDAGHEDALLARWPSGVPGLSEATEADFPAILQAIHRTEADVSFPFDPPPAAPVVKEKPTPPAPVSTKPEADEGGEVADDDVEKVEKAFLFLEDEGEAWIADLAGRTGNLSISEKATARRVLIGWSLVRLAAAGWHDDELLAAVIDRSEVVSSFPEDVASFLSTCGWSHAVKISDTVSDLVEDRLQFSVSPETGKMRLEAA